MMQMMLRGYLTTFSQMSINESDFRAYYESFVNDNFASNGTEIISLTNWDTWVKAPGIPPQETFDFSTELLDEAIALALAYIELDGTASPENYEDFFNYMNAQTFAFVQTLKDSEQVDAELLAYIDSDLNITTTADPALKTLWFQLGISRGYEAVMEPARMWMSEQGRNFYVKPTFGELVDAGECSTAMEWFAENEDFYNSYVVSGVSRVIAEECSNGGEPGDGEGDGGEPAENGGSSGVASFFSVSGAQVVLAATVFLFV